MKRKIDMMWFKGQRVPVKAVEELARKAMEPVDRIYEARMSRGDREGAIAALMEPLGGRSMLRDRRSDGSVSRVDVLEA